MLAGYTPSSGPIQTPFSGQLLNDAIANSSMACWWYPAEICDCWGQMLQQVAETASPDPSCPDCQGRGYLFPVRNVVDGVLFSNMVHNSTWREGGINTTGNVLLTVPYITETASMYLTLAQRDIIIPLDYDVETTQLIVKGVDSLRYPPTRIDAISYNGTLYNQGTDYTFAANNITWVGNAPPSGAYYMVRYAYHPIYTVIKGLSTLRNYGHLNFPRSYHLEYAQELGDIVVDQLVNG